MGLAYFATIFTSKGLWSAYDPMYTRIYGFASSAILFFGYLILLRWKKMGFYILIGMAGINQIINFVAGAPISLSTFFPIISAIILRSVANQQRRRNMLGSALIIHQRGCCKTKKLQKTKRLFKNEC